MGWKVALIAAALVAVVAVDASLIMLHDDSTPYDPQQALTQFRREAAAAPTPTATRTGAPAARTAAHPAPAATQRASATVGGTAPRRAPAAGAHPTSSPAAAAEEVVPGVYRYATAGHEEVDALGGARHDYPAETAVSYRRVGCGTEDRWQPLKERYSLNTLCRGAAGLEARDSVQRREFYGQSEEQVLACAPGLVLVPADPRPGRTFSGSCRSDDTVIALTARVLDVSSMSVGGRRAEAIHVRVEGTLSGSTRGSTQRDEWFTRGGLLLRARATTDTDRDTSAGTVHYSETYDIRLASLQPQR